MRKYNTVENALDGKYVVAQNGCWEWTGARAGTTWLFSYGKVKVAGKSRRAHRVSWMKYHGEIPEGMLVLHKCNNPCCVNPDHLYLGDKRDNALYSMESGTWKQPPPPPLKTHCKYGHEFTDGSYFINPRGARVCKICYQRKLDNMKQLRLRVKEMRCA